MFFTARLGNLEIQLDEFPDTSTRRMEPQSHHSRTVSFAGDTKRVRTSDGRLSFISKTTRTTCGWDRFNGTIPRYSYIISDFSQNGRTGTEGRHSNS